MTNNGRQPGSAVPHLGGKKTKKEQTELEKPSTASKRPGLVPGVIRVTENAEPEDLGWGQRRMNNEAAKGEKSTPQNTPTMGGHTNVPRKETTGTRQKRKPR